MLHYFYALVAQLNFAIFEAIRVRLRNFVKFLPDLMSCLHIDLQRVSRRKSGGQIAFFFMFSFATTFASLTLAII